MMTMSRSQESAVLPGRDFLDQIVAATRERIVRLRTQRPFESLADDARRYTRRSLSAAVVTNAPAIIAEVKMASPSKGLFRRDFDPIGLATSYESGGAAALSVVTEPRFFHGEDSWVGKIRERTRLPVLRKDFVLDPLQVAESAALGADAILLIARILSESQLQELHDAASQLGLDVLCEAHDEGDLEKLAACHPKLVGVNARNLDTFVVDTGLFQQLKPRLPVDAVAVAESGIESATQIRAAAGIGYSGFLVGETLVRSHDPASIIRALRGGEGE